MRYILYALALFVTFLLGSVTHAAEPISACTMQYAPVCGSVEVQCVRAPCYPVRQTFGNQCMANMANATNITIGECGAIPGGDADIHGCIASAGYRWESRAKQCLRPWESRVRILYVAPDTRTCTGTGLLTECLQIRLSFEKFWTNYFGNITGFEYMRGYMYRLLVLETNLENPPVGNPAISYSLIRVLNSKPTPIVVRDTSPIMGAWKLTHFNTSDVSTSNLSATFTRDQFSIKLCNTIGGTYSLNANTIAAPQAMTTLMYCDGLPMTLENAWSLDAATYVLTSIPVMAGTTGPSMRLTITMRNGNIFTFTK